MYGEQSRTITTRAIRLRLTPRLLTGVARLSGAQFLQTYN